MIEKIPTLHMSREDWLLERRRSIGGSDAGAILGLNRYRSPYTVWAEKTGRLPEQEDNEAMRQGRDLEDYVARRFAEKSGKRVERYNYLLRNTDAPHLHANIDRRVVGEKAGLECKTASALSLKSYKGGQFPESYYVQCAAYLAVTGWQRWYLAALVLNKAFYIYQITTVEGDPLPAWCESSVYVSPKELAALTEYAAAFWENYIASDAPPPADGSESTTDTMKTVLGDDTGGEIELFGRDKDLARYFVLASEKKDIERNMEKIKQTVMQDMGSAARAFCGNYNVSFASQTRQALDRKLLQKRYPHIDLSGCWKTTAVRPIKITEVQ